MSPYRLHGGMRLADGSRAQGGHTKGEGGWRNFSRFGFTLVAPFLRNDFGQESDGQWSFKVLADEAASVPTVNGGPCAIRFPAYVQAHAPI